MTRRTLALVSLCGLLPVLVPGCGGGDGVTTTPPPTFSITTASLPDGFVAFPYRQQISASGGAPPLTWTVSSGALPNDLTLADASGSSATISGTPATAQSAAMFTIQATDSKNQVATKSYTINIQSTQNGQLQEVQGQAPGGTVEIQGLGAASFNSTYWEQATLNWVPDVRTPMLAPQPTSPYQNIYAPSALEQSTGWRLFYGGWDGSDTPNDRVYSVTTNDFLSFADRALVIDHGAFVHVNNVNVQRLNDGSLHMICTVYPDQNNLNKPAYFFSPDGETWNESAQPYRAQLGDIVSIQGYTNFQSGDFNGANVLLWDGRVWTLYFSNWNDQGPTGTLYRATTDSLPAFQLQGVTMNTIYAVQDVKIFQSGGKNWYVVGFHDNTSLLWYSLSNDGINFSKEKTLFVAHPSGEDQYMVSLGFVTSGGRLLGVLYGAGASSSLDQNRIFARWLQKKVVISDSTGVQLTLQGGYGPDRQWFQMPASGSLQGTILIYAEDGVTPLASGAVNLSGGKAHQLVLGPGTSVNAR